jgi:integrase
MEQLLLLTAACDDYDPRLGFAVHLAAVTGARRGELLALRWSDFDLGRRVVQFAYAIVLGDGGKPMLKRGTKTGGRRTVSLDDTTIRRLAMFRELSEQRVRETGSRLIDTAFLFYKELGGAEPISPDAFSRMYEQARAKVGLKNLKFHSLRHWHATCLLNAGISVNTVAGRLGHSGGGRTTLSTYAHFLEPADRQAAEVAIRYLNQEAA